MRLVATDSDGGRSTYVRGIYVGNLWQGEGTRPSDFRVLSADLNMKSCGREVLEECHPLVTISVNVEFVAPVKWSLKIEGEARKFDGESRGDMQRRVIEEYLQELREQDPKISKEMIDKMRAILEGQR